MAALASLTNFAAHVMGVTSVKNRAADIVTPLCIPGSTHETLPPEVILKVIPEGSYSSENENSTKKIMAKNKYSRMKVRHSKGLRFWAVPFPSNFLAREYHSFSAIE